MLAINKTKVIGYKLVLGSFNGESFNTFINDKVIANSKKASLFMDNARIHHYKKFKENMKERKKDIIYNIPYSPQFNPIEYVFNVLKIEIAKQYVDTYEALIKFIDRFIIKMNKITFNKYFQKSYKNLFE